MGADNVLVNISGLGWRVFLPEKDLFRSFAQEL